VGRRLSRLPSGWWLIGYLVPLVAVLLCGAAFRYPPLELVVPFAWLMGGRREYLVLAFGGAMVFGTLLPRLRLRRQRTVLGVLVAVIVLIEAAWPFLAPAFNRRHLASLVTQFDGDGVCIQNTDYTCGPAATVTVLKEVGVRADEGELAILFGTTSSTGSPADTVAARLTERFRAADLRAELRAFRSVEELRGQTPMLAWMKFAFLTDHVVAVLEVGPERVVVGDPFRGRRVLTPAEFESEWRFVGVVFRSERPRARPSGG
jgi:predicted double-glycine peptidase